MRILFLSAEVAPFSKTGGLGDVAAALPAHLQEYGHDAMTVSPLYGTINREEQDLRQIFEGVEVESGPFGMEFSAWLAPDGRNWFIDIPYFYDRGSIYTSGPDEHLRFIFFTRAALELAKRRTWQPDIIHANDWHTALAPLYLRSIYRTDPTFAAAADVFTIHNLTYQGVFDSSITSDLGLGEERYLLHQDHLAAGYVNFMEHALLYVDAITTVSPTYAQEIQTPEMGEGLDGLLRRRRADLTGILNGIDTRVWNPATDRHLVANYSIADLAGKKENRMALMSQAGLDDIDVPLVGIVSRLTAQKGIELMIRPLSWLLEADRIRFVGIGTGEPRYEEALSWLASSFPGRAQFAPVYSERLAHLIEAGSDIFVMPSRFEPSGLNQMYSLAYGTAPVVRWTGGLADTVRHYSLGTGEGNGFVFEHFTEEGFSGAMSEALRVYRDGDGWRQMQLNGMGEDNSWTRRAGEYVQLYESLSGQS